MDIIKNERVFDALPADSQAQVDLEDLQEANPYTKFNFANIAAPTEPVEYECLNSVASQVNGLNIQFHDLEQNDLVPLHAFRNVEYLRISFPDSGISSEMSTFFKWVKKLDRLQAISLNNTPEDPDQLRIFLQLIATVNSKPVYIFAGGSKSKGKSQRKSKVRSASHMLEIEGVTVPKGMQAMNCKSPELSSEGVQKALEAEHKKFYSKAYKGELVVEGGEWELSIESLVYKPEHEAVIQVKGVDSIGHFDLGLRLDWKVEQGGFYFAKPRPMNYQNHSSKDENTGSLKLIQIVQHINGTCFVKGLWVQGGYEWAVSGDLVLI